MHRAFRIAPLAAALALTPAVPAHAFGGLGGLFGAMVGAPTPAPAAAAPAGLFGGLLGGAAMAQQPTARQQQQLMKLSSRYKAIRSEKDMAKLFERGKITGKEALTELKAMRGAVSGAGPQGAMAQLMGYDSNALGLGGDQQGAQMFGAITSLMSGNFSDAALDMLVTTISVNALEHFFTNLTENPNFFAEETVELPKLTAVMAPEQQQRVLVLAASLIAIKGSNKIIEASKNDFERAKQGYQRLIDKREKAAGVLASALEAWRMASEEQKELEARKLGAYLNKADLEFLASFNSETRLKDFAKDFTAQNIALEFLRKKGDSDYKDYKAEADEYVTNLNGHLRKTVGLGSLLGFSSLFLKEGKRAFQKEGAESILVVLPFADQYLSEIGKAASEGLPSLVGGVFSDLFGGEDEFRIDKTDGTVVKKGTGASGVLSFLKDEEAVANQFKDMLYRDDSQGYLYRANLCDNAAAPMLDKAVPNDAKKEFVKNFYRLEEAGDFNFKDAFEGGFQGRRKDELVSSLLNADYRQNARNDTQKAVGEVQKISEGGISKWESRDIAQIIFASSVEGPLAHASLKVGDYVVRMIPSQWMVYEYENYQQNCLKDVTARIKPTLARSDKTSLSDAPAAGSGKKSRKKP